MDRRFDATPLNVRRYRQRRVDVADMEVMNNNGERIVVGHLVFSVWSEGLPRRCMVRNLK
jgi:hypothetical protein